MQKLLTVSINTALLKSAPRGPFTITDVAGINELLLLGWTIQDWEFISRNGEDGQAVALLILNDEAGQEDFEVSSYSQSAPQEDPDEESADDREPGNGDLEDDLDETEERNEEEAFSTEKDYSEGHTTGLPRAVMN